MGFRLKNSSGNRTGVSQLEFLFFSTVSKKMWLGLRNFSVNIIAPKKYFTNANSALFYISNYRHFNFDY